jgi:hypothetical protein
VAQTRPSTEGKRRVGVSRLAQRLVHPFGGVAAHRGHPVRIPIEGKLDAGGLVRRWTYCGWMRE